MRYIYPVIDINNYALDMLAQETRNAGLNAQAIHSGNGVLLFEFEAAINDAEKLTLQNIVSSHSPAWFEWTENNQRKRHKVKCAEDIDRLTAMRIRNLLGGNDAVQEQLKLLTQMLKEIYQNVQAATSLADLKTRFQTNLTSYQSFLTDRDSIIQQGKDFKTGKGW